MRLLTYFKGLFFMSSVLWLQVEPCGISTHIEIAHRALEFFNHTEGTINYKELLRKYPEAYQAGSVYPDTFYQGICEQGKYHDVSEDTHWTPFLKASIDYIRDVYPQPWDESAQKLVAFLFGIASHMVSDVSWHSLGIHQGFLQSMAEVDFYGSYSEAHGVGDFGGDVVSRYEFNFDYSEAKWYIPVKDLFNIYNLLYGKTVIEENTIVHCTYILFLELYGESLGISKLYSTYSSKSPFLVERFQEYFLGGVDDMAYWSTNIFLLTSFMLNNGTRLAKKIQQRNGFNEDLAPLITTSIEADRFDEESGVVFQINSWGQYPNHITSPSASYFVSSPYARLGWVMTSADLNQDGNDDLVIGAPGYSTLGHLQTGRVYIVYGTEGGLPSSSMDLDKDANIILQGYEPSGRFGSSVAVLDFNVDGILDLAVGAPSVGSQHLTYTGSVYVFFGSGREGFSSHPNVTVTCKVTFCNLGWSLLAADMNKDRRSDLVIGSPYAPGRGQQRGLVVAFYSRSIRKGRLSVEEAEWSMMGEHDYAWFGYSLYSHQFRNRTLLIVGSPTWNQCNRTLCDDASVGLQRVGKAYGFYPPSRNVSIQVQGDTEQSKLGSSFASGIVSINGAQKHILLIGAPTQSSTSRVAFLTRELHHAGTASVLELKAKSAPIALSTLSGDRSYGNFGTNIHLNDLDKDGLDEIIVTSPLRNDDVTSMLFGAQAGRVYIYNGNTTSPGCLTNKCKSWISPCPEDWAQYVLISPEEKSRFGSAVTTIKSKQKSQVVVAAVRSSVKARLAGALHIYNIG
ncbi:hypothetical protein GDO86_011208 [Hymenochirus boettgeri]|uniref:Phosphatidylinositol-glycan-specific phospholipase D n=1 Tax=Hymenochirus boettgeri TaxID=247094 RepID=A0A8T2JI79_9PIPI|nr:hypothetical protein GDO86_011208 [Hymenochirus boettgeri]